MKKKEPLIFVIDRNKNYRHLVVNALEAFNLTNILTFSETKLSFEALNQQPDLVILEYSTEDNPNGLELMKKAKIKFPSVEFIFLSSKNDIELAVETIRLGAADYIIKSKYALSKLMSRVEKIIQFHNSLKKARRLQKQLIFSLGLVLVSLITLVILYNRHIF